MKKIYIIWGILIVSNLFSQNKKYDTILFKNIKIDNHELYFHYKKIKDLESIYGKLNKNSNKTNTAEKIPLHYHSKLINSFSNDEVSLLITSDRAFIDYFNFELSKNTGIIYYKNKKIILSKNMQLSQFKKVFKNSYENASGLPVIALERAAFISAYIINKKSIGYISFTFYDSKLISIFISDHKPENF
ncbi:hypothetical protein [Flavobacterium sp. FlaQc-47]|uniref:hypothetical protein n=1 Tax=Flavobacterium sp. FlaQc-47 TaxID=3374180 RepID=UPI003756D7D6